MTPNSLVGITDLIADGLAIADASTGDAGVNARTRQLYHPGLPAMRETTAVDHIARSLRERLPMERFSVSTEVTYKKNRRNHCDLVVEDQHATQQSLFDPFIVAGWAIEVKRLQFVGNNGKNNDFNVQKVLSPYLKDRSVIHDIERMRSDALATRQAVVAYAFEYSLESCHDAARYHPAATDVITEIRTVCLKNDPINGIISAEPLAEMANHHFDSLGLISDHCLVRRQNLWNHPAGGTLAIFAWEVSNDG